LIRPDAPPAEPVFKAPWEAQAFAMAVESHRRGVFAWPEFAAALSAELLAAGAGQDGDDYYEHWLTALEKLLAAKAAIPEAERLTRYAAWDAAAKATPHGEPIVLGRGAKAS
jgi:nitrile hydratase accessory protein